MPDDTIHKLLHRHLLIQERLHPGGAVKANILWSYLLILGHNSRQFNDRFKLTDVSWERVLKQFFLRFLTDFKLPHLVVIGKLVQEMFCNKYHVLTTFT